MTKQEIRLKKNPTLYHLSQLENRGRYNYITQFHDDLICKINIL